MHSPAKYLETIWDDLKSGIDEIFQLQPAKFSRYMQLHWHVHTYCTFVDHRSPTYTRCDQEYVGAKLVGVELYKRVRDYLKARVVSIKSKGDNLTGEEILSYYEKAWSDYRFSSRVLSGVCDYLNRNWIKRVYEEGRKNIYFIFPLALVTWQEQLLRPHSQALITAILHEIDQERRGEVLFTSRLRKIIDSLVDLDIVSDNHPQTPGSSTTPYMNEHNVASNAHTNTVSQTVPTPNPIYPSASQAMSGSSLPYSQVDIPLPPDATHPHLTIYQELFERPFLEETERFYRAEGVQLLESLSISEYLQKVEARLNEERARVQAYLHPSTLPKLIGMCEFFLIGRHLSRLSSELVNLLNNDREEDIWRLHMLVAHFPQGVRTLGQIVEEFIGNKGSEALRQVAATAVNDPTLYVDTILQIYRKYSNLVSRAFTGAPAFMQALDKGCERFINRNAVTEAAGSSRKSPELLAKYTDLLLKKGPKDQQVDDLEGTLSEVMSIFKFLEDKDVFQKFYGKTLARRLVYGQSVSEDAEASMISKLKETCGFEYTSKLQRMFQDLHATRELNSKFASSAQMEELAKGIDFNVMVLSSNAWPYQAQTPFSIPPELELCQNTFLSFYQEHHTGRKLSWCYQLSRGELVTRYTKTLHTFQVSTLQAAILLLYNSALVLTVNSIQSETSIEESSLIQVLNILVKAKVLKIVEGTTSATAADPSSAAQPATTDSTGTQLSGETQLALYTDYRNKRVRVNLNVPLKSEAKQESEQTLGNVDLDRKLFVQACIVRIMKTRKAMKHTHLVNEVITQLSSRFKPTLPLIKRCITELIDREYLKRDSSERDAYEYLA